MRRVAIALAAGFVLRAASVFADEGVEEARRHEVMGRFDEAAAVLEREAARSSTAEGVPRRRAWLERALEYRVALGDWDGALRDARALARIAEAGRGAEAELEAATVLVRAGRWAESARFHDGWLRRYGGAASAGLRARALTELGDALREAGSAERAAGAYERAVGAMAGRNAQEREAAAPWLARARFWVAEREFRAFMARRMPRYAGSDERRAYDRWAQRTLNPFVREQVQLLREDLTRLYTEVVNLHVPRWEVAAYSRLGTMFHLFAEQIRNMPPPPDIARHPELLEAYCQLRDCWEPGGFRPEHVATEGFRRCLATATHLREANEFSRECEERLNAIDRARYPMADEIVPTPDRGLRP